MSELKLPETGAKTTEERLEEIAKSRLATKFEAVKEGSDSFVINGGVFRTYPDGIEALVGHDNNFLLVALYSQKRNMIIRYSIKNENKDLR